MSPLTIYIFSGHNFTGLQLDVETPASGPLPVTLFHRHPNALHASSVTRLELLLW